MLNLCCPLIRFTHVPPALMSGRKCVSISLVAKKLVLRVSSAWTGNGVVSATKKTDRINPGWFQMRTLPKIHSSEHTFESYCGIVDENIHSSVLLFKVGGSGGDALHIVDVQLVKHGGQSL